MAIPTANIPVIKAPTQVAPPKIYTAQVPSIPLLGSPASDYRNYLQQKADRSSRFFNINDPNQINSVADVVMKTVEGLWNTGKGEDTLGNTLWNTAENSWSLINHGIIQPIAHGDWAALGLNQLVNIGETIDIVDNIWKGMLMEGTEGIRKASFGRTNYEWDTGNKVGDFLLEMATPTNLLTLGLDAAAKGVVKEAAEETSSQLSKKILKKFARAYDGNIDSTIIRMQKGINLTANQVTQLKDISMHATNLKLLKSLNTVRTATNFIDDIGPKMVYGSTFLPFKEMVKFGFGTAGAVMKYTAKQFEDAVGAMTVVNLVKNSAKYGIAVKTMADAVKLAEVEQIDPAPFEDILSDVAKLEVKKFKSLFKEYSSTAVDRTLIYDLIEQQRYIEGQAISFEVAEQMHISAKTEAFMKALDDKAAVLSGGQYTTFTEYTAAVSKLYHSSSAGVGIEPLYDYVTRLNKFFEERALHTAEAVVRPLRGVINNFIMWRTDLKEKLRQNAIDSASIDQSILHKAGSGWADFAVESLENAVRTLRDNPNDPELQRELFELVKTYDATFDEATKKWIVGNFDVPKSTIKIDKLALDTEYLFNFMHNHREITNNLKEAMTTVYKEIVALKKANMLNVDWANAQNKRLLHHYKKLLALPTTYNKLKVNGVINYPRLAAYSEELDALVNDLSLIVNQVSESMIIETSTKEGFTKLTNRIMGASSATILDGLEQIAGKSRRNKVREAIKQTIKTKQGINMEVLGELQKRFYSLRVSSKELIDILAHDLGDSTLMQEMSYATAETVETIERLLRGITLAPDDQVVDRIADALVEMKALADTIKTARKSIDATKMRKTPSAKHALELNSLSLKNISDIIDDTISMFEVDTDITLKQTLENIRTYQVQLNAVYRNLMILNTKPVQEMLDMIDEGQFKFDPALKTIDAISNFDLGKWTALMTALEGTDERLIAELYHEITGGRGVIPVDEAARAIFKDDLKMLFDEVRELQEASLVVMDTLSGMASVRQLYALIYSKTDELGESITHHLMDALQNHYDAPATLVHGDTMAEVLAEIKTNINNQIRNSVSNKSFKLQNWRKHVPAEAIAEYDALFPGEMSHTAIADSYAEHMIRKHILIGSDDPLHKIVYSDLETSTTNRFGSTIHQQSVVIPEAGIFRWYINVGITEGQYASDEVLRLMFGEDHDIKYLRSLYEDIHINGNIDALKKHFDLPEDSPIEIIPIGNKLDSAGDIELGSEAHLIETVEAYIKSQKPAQGSLKVAMFNGKDYDAELIMNRRKALRVPGWINKEDIIDTRLELEARYGVQKLSPEQEEAIDDIISRYTTIRELEMTANAHRRKLTLNDYYSILGKGKFIPTADDSFRDALNRINTYFSTPFTSKTGTANALAKQYDVHKALFTHKATHPSLKILNEFTADITESITRIKDIQDQLGEISLVAANRGDFTFNQRLIDADYFKGIDGELADKYNIGIDIMQTNRVDGVYMPVIGLRNTMNHNVVLRWFDTVPNTKLAEATGMRMTKVGRRIERTLEKIKNVDALATYLVKDGVPKQDPARAMKELIEIQEIIVRRIGDLNGSTQLSPVLSQLKPRTNLLEQYAVVHEIWKTYTAIEFDMRKGANEFLPLYDELIKVYPDRMLDVRFDGRILHGIIGDTNHARTFQLGDIDADMEVMIDYYTKVSQMPIRTLSEFEQLQESTISASRLKRMAPVYNKLHESFRIAQEIAERTERKEAVYSYLRMPMEAMNEIIGYQKLVDVLRKDVNGMASYLWHQANGVVAFKNSDLVSRNYFKRRNGIDSVDVLNSEDAMMEWTRITNNKAAYEAAGISFASHGGWTYMYIKEENLNRFIDLPYQRIDYDYDISERMRTFINSYAEAYENLRVDIDAVRRLINSTIEARDHLLRMTPDGMGSTLEHMDSKVMSDLLKQIDIRLPGVVGIDTLRANHRFDGNMYNHSILGSINSRRELMPFTSFTPAKTMFHSAELAHDRISKQMQFTMLLQDPLMQLSNITDGMNNDEIFQYLKNAPHLNLVFLQAHKTKGYKVSKIIVNSPKDIDFAMKMGAVVLDRNTYVKAYEIINQNRIPEGLFKFLERAIIAPFKIGWMAYNIGTVLRNLADSGLKNLQTTGDLRIIPEMSVMFKTYWDYKKDIADLLDYQKVRKIEIDQAIKEYFRDGRNRVSFEDFMMIDEFKKSGSTSGMVREMQEYYGDSVQKLYHKLKNEKSGVSKDEFRELMRMAPEEAAQWLDRLPQLTEKQVRDILEARADLFYYKRAYAMHKRTGKLTKHLSVEDFVVYQKRGNVDGFIPPELTAEIEKLMDATKNVSVDETTFDKIMAHPLVDKALDMNAGVEEVMRLAMFKHLKAEGYSVAEAMNEIIKTHFDYGHKSQAQMWLEMIAPFSTFRINSFLYWTDMLSRSSMGMEIISKYWKESSNVTERDPEDYYLRRGLQYQMMSGNPVLDDETGLTLKLSPSVMDALQFIRNPVEYLTDSLFMTEEVMTFINMEQYQGESQEDYNLRKKKAASKLIPVVGTIYSRAVADKNHNPLVNLLISPLVNRTWTPEQRVQKPRFYYAQNQKSRYTAAKIRRARFSSYSPFNKIYYAAMYRTRNGIPYGTKAFRSVNRWHKLAWSKTMSSKHKQKYALLSFPTNKYTLKMKVQLLRRLTAVR